MDTEKNKKISGYYRVTRVNLLILVENFRKTSVFIHKVYKIDYNG